jgi:proline iminopeptidase
MKLFPAIKKFKTLTLKVDTLHNLYIEEKGNPKGIPVICLHGGPGAPIYSAYERFMNPKKFHILYFHQRGCGKSTPHGSLVRNQTKYIIQDMEKIRKHFKIDKWIVYGGSWGGSLTILYGIKHPKRCLALVPSSLSLFDRYNEQCFITMAPELHNEWKLNKKLNDKQNMRLYLTHLKRKSKKHIQKWNHVESKLFQLMNFPKLGSKSKKKFKLKPKDAFTTALFECYYYYNRAFIKGNLLRNIQKKLKNVPGYIIHGRYDLICSPSNAYLAHKHWKKSKLYIAELSGHAANDREMAKITLKVFQLIAKRYSK